MEAEAVELVVAIVRERVRANLVVVVLFWPRLITISRAADLSLGKLVFASKVAASKVDEAALLLLASCVGEQAPLASSDGAPSAC